MYYLLGALTRGGWLGRLRAHKYGYANAELLRDWTESRAQKPPQRRPSQPRWKQEQRRGVMEIGRGGGGGGEDEGRRRRGSWRAVMTTETQKERDFPSSSWEILPVSLQPERTVTHDYFPPSSAFNFSLTHTHTHAHTDTQSVSQLPPRSL